mmetsp:Transcript_25683/g.51570  ORF Transcript_25683/g.51570 Transcript_25683/m.51570 type:complete len:207 (+) Transcript_25683:109-729(+)
MVPAAAAAAAVLVGEEEEVDHGDGVFGKRKVLTSSSSSSSLFSSTVLTPPSLLTDVLTVMRSKSGGKGVDAAVKRFKACPGPCVLLLPVQSSGQGLTLTEATKVLVVDPIPDPSQLAQVAARVNRIGQTRETQVLHFVVGQSVEALVHKQSAKHATRKEQQLKEQLREKKQRRGSGVEGSRSSSSSSQRSSGGRGEGGSSSSSSSS